MKDIGMMLLSLHNIIIRIQEMYGLTDEEAHKIVINNKEM